MMKIKKVALIAFALLLVLSVFALFGCEQQVATETIKGLPEYTFKNIEYPNYLHQERWLEPDEGMTIDGKLSEEAWAGQNYLKISGSGYSCRVTTVFGEKGVYFGIDVDDPYVYVNPARADWQNTGIELHIARAGVTNREEAVMLRLTPLEMNVGGMRGSYAEGNINGYVWDWVPFYVKSFVDGEMEEGLVATSSCNGLSWEILLPWEALGMSEPGDIVCLPAYNHCEGYDENAGRLREHIQYLGDMFTVQTWPTFTAKGSVIEQDDETDVIGDGLTGGQKTAGWDLTERDNGKIVSNGGNVQEIWFREQDAQWYMIEAVLSNAKPHNDVWPSGGIILSDDHNGHGIRIQLFIGYDGNGQQWFKVYDLNRTEPEIQQVDFIGDCGAKSKNGVRIKVIRHYKDFWVYINDVLMYKGTSDELSNAGIAGLYTVGMDATFTDYQYTAEPTLPSADEIPFFNPDLGTEKIGDAIAGSKPSKTSGWDLTERENGKVSAVTGGVQEIWFREQAAEWYMIETTISKAKPSSDVWPSGGIILGDDGQGNGIRIQLFIGYNGNGQQWVKVYDLDRAEPPIKQVDFAGDCGAKSAEGVKLKVVRYYKEFWVYVNDKLMYYGTSDELSNAGITGLYTVGMEAVFTDCKYTAQPEVPTDKLE